MLTEKEILEDFWRFVRHEAMRANCKQPDILRIIKYKQDDSETTD